MKYIKKKGKNNQPIREKLCEVCGKKLLTRSNRLKYCYRHKTPLMRRPKICKSYPSSESTLKKYKDLVKYNTSSTKVRIFVNKKNCLKCGIKFKSEGRYNRVCDICNKENKYNKRSSNNVTFDNRTFASILNLEYYEEVKG